MTSNLTAYASFDGKASNAFNLEIIFVVNYSLLPGECADA